NPGIATHAGHDEECQAQKPRDAGEGFHQTPQTDILRRPPARAVEGAGHGLPHFSQQEGWKTPYRILLQEHHASSMRLHVAFQTIVVQTARQTSAVEAHLIPSRTLLLIHQLGNLTSQHVEHDQIDLHGSWQRVRDGRRGIEWVRIVLLQDDGMRQFRLVFSRRRELIASVVEDPHLIDAAVEIALRGRAGVADSERTTSENRRALDADALLSYYLSVDVAYTKECAVGGEHVECVVPGSGVQAVIQI